MTTSTSQKLQRESKSLLGLSIINFVCSGLAMAFGISTLVLNINLMVTARSLLFPELAWLVLGFLSFAVGIRWIIASVEVLEISEQLKEGTENRTQDEDTLTGIIVGAMASYREKRSTIKLMMIISRIAGVCFIISGLFTLATAATIADPSVNLMLQIAGASVNFAIAVAAFIIPHFFSKYQQIWDNRLKETEKAEKLLEQQLGVN